jgi:hypothetical protein
VKKKTKLTSKVCQGGVTSTLKRKEPYQQSNKCYPKLNNNDRVSARWIGG